MEERWQSGGGVEIEHKWRMGGVVALRSMRQVAQHGRQARAKGSRTTGGRNAVGDSSGGASTLEWLMVAMEAVVTVQAAGGDGGCQGHR